MSINVILLELKNIYNLYVWLDIIYSIFVNELDIIVFCFVLKVFKEVVCRLCV